MPNQVVSNTGRTDTTQTPSTEETSRGSSPAPLTGSPSSSGENSPRFDLSQRSASSAFVFPEELKPFEKLQEAKESDQAALWKECRKAWVSSEALLATSHGDFKALEQAWEATLGFFEGDVRKAIQEIILDGEKVERLTDRPLSRQEKRLFHQLTALDLWRGTSVMKEGGGTSLYYEWTGKVPSEEKKGEAENRKLVILSNRHGLNVKRQDSGERDFSLSPGGVAVALDAASRDKELHQELGISEVTWVGHRGYIATEGDEIQDAKAVQDYQERVKLPYQVKYTPDIDQELFDGYYGIAANEIEWPEYHGASDRADANRERIGEEQIERAHYAQVLAGVKFAFAALDEMDNGNDWVWNHDYQLTFAGPALQALEVKHLGFFFHISFMARKEFFQEGLGKHQLLSILDHSNVGLQSYPDLKAFLEVTQAALPEAKVIVRCSAESFNEYTEKVEAYGKCISEGDGWIDIELDLRQNVSKYTEAGGEYYLPGLNGYPNHVEGENGEKVVAWPDVQGVFVEQGGKRARLSVDPIIIDPELLQVKREEEKLNTERLQKELEEKGIEKYLFSAERSDYTKAIPYRLLSYLLFLNEIKAEAHPLHSLSSQIFFRQIAAFGRADLGDYQEEMELIRAVDRVMQHFFPGKLELGEKGISYEEVVTHMGAATTVLATSWLDGQNLVQFEGAYLSRGSVVTTKRTGGYAALLRAGLQDTVVAMERPAHPLFSQAGGGEEVPESQISLMRRIQEEILEVDGMDPKLRKSAEQVVRLLETYDLQEHVGALEKSVGASEEEVLAHQEKIKGWIEKEHHLARWTAHSLRPLGGDFTRS